jgi:hypothetical protein
MAEKTPNPAEATGEIDGEISYRSIALFLGGLAVVAASSFALVFGLLKGANAWSDRNAPRQAAIAKENPQGSPPEPRLEAPPQRAAAEALRPGQFASQPVGALRTEEERILSSWRWVAPDRSAGRIPVDRAVQLLLRKGFPTRSAPLSPTGGSK